MYFLVTPFNFNKADELDLTRINLIRIPCIAATTRNRVQQSQRDASHWICNVYLSCQINQFNGCCRFKVRKYLNRNEYECS